MTALLTAVAFIGLIGVCILIMALMVTASENDADEDISEGWGR